MLIINELSSPQDTIDFSRMESQLQPNELSSLQDTIDFSRMESQLQPVINSLC